MKKRIAIITGAGGTLGSEMARNLAAQGIRIVLMGRSMEKLEAVEKEIKTAGGEVMSVSADTSDQIQVEEAARKVLDQWGPCSILINCAGGNQPDAVTNIREFQPEELNGAGDIRGFFNLSMDTFRSVVDINTMGTVIPCFVFGRQMAENGYGNIVNIASMNSYRPLSRVGAYGMAKAAIVNFTQWLAGYLASAGIRVNAIAPGFFLNDRSRKLLLDGDGYTQRGASIIGQTPMRKFGEANELTGCLNWLIDDEAAGFVTGITIPVDGGFLTDSGI